MRPMDIIGDVHQYTASQCCDRCGRPFLVTRKDVALDGEFLARGDQRVKLTFREMEFLKPLVEHLGATVHRDRIWNAVWGHDSERDPKAIDVYQCRINKKIKPLGLVIRSTWGIGKVLDFADSDAADRATVADVMQAARGADYVLGHNFSGAGAVRHEVTQ